jgi:IclR family transcriptional regulator, acetate operon repressor
MEAVGAHQGGVPAEQLARETGLALGTAYHLLRTMVHDGYVRKPDDGTFVLGERLGALHAGSRNQAALSRVRPTLKELRDGLDAHCQA